MQFVKMHGIGNDYVFVNAFETPVERPQELARRIADRHAGVGGDGLILLLPPQAGVGEPAHVRMRMFNADGSEAEMCGNGIRCLCKLAHDHGICGANPMRVQTPAGVLTLRYTTDARCKVDMVTVDMGAPILEPRKIPVKIDNLARIVNHSTRSLIDWPARLPADWKQACGLDQRMTCVSMGNPHVVFFCDNVDRVPLETVGPLVENHAVFPSRVNVHFVQVDAPAKLTMVTWERGSGATLACGTGASAVCVAGVLTDRTDRRIQAHLPGGALTLEWSKQDDHLYMTGPAVEVFTGQWPGQMGRE
jgi:diaminopimelate epimerase